MAAREGRLVSSVLRVPAPAGAGFEALRRSPLRGFDRRHLWVVLLFGALMPATYAVFAAVTGEPIGTTRLLAEAILCLCVGFAAMLTAHLAANTLRHRMGTTLRLSVTILAAAILALGMVEFAEYAVFLPLGIRDMYASGGHNFFGTAHRLIFELADIGRWALMLVVLYELLEASRRAGDELHAAQMAALVTEHDLVEGDLRAAQARVDPDFLFESLRNVELAYAAAMEQGQERLDALIRFLRAALPGDDTGTSTVARERELAEAYVGVVRPAAASTFECNVSVEPTAGTEALPPMLLLPLVRWALGGEPAQRLIISIGRRDALLEIVVRSPGKGRGAPDERELDAIRERLRQLYPAGARIDASVEHGMRQAVLALPLLQSI